MIKLKNEINKSATMRELRKEAEKMYEHSFMCDERIEDFMFGAETLFNLLRLPRAIVPKGTFYCDCFQPSMQKPISETEYECFDCGKEVKQFGSFSANDVERAYDDGYSTEGEVNFDIENYR
jgi:hypothetical protein